jgi:peptide-methionine (S)-S-oxide reductase
MQTTLRIALVLSIAGLGACAGPRAGDAASDAPEARESTMTDTADSARTATLGGGCFWCLEAFYERIEGVEDVVSGYAGGDEPDPSYRQVGSGETGHAEVVQVRFDPAKISYRELLEIFFTMHDPTTLNRQGADVGPQYRSIILHHSPEQKAEADRIVRELEAENVFEDPIVTEIKPYEAFYPAEVSHQDYYARNPQAGYCRVVIAPKLDKLRAKYANRLKPQYQR